MRSGGGGSCCSGEDGVGGVGVGVHRWRGNGNATEEMKIGDQCWGLGRRGLGLVGYHGAS